jgi:hypothetical protein
MEKPLGGTMANIKKLKGIGERGSDTSHQEHPQIILTNLSIFGHNQREVKQTYIESKSLELINLRKGPISRFC